MIVGIGGVRSRLTGRLFYYSKLSIVRDAQGFERDVDPSDCGSRIYMVTREVRYKSSGRGREQARGVDLYRALGGIIPL